MKAITKNSSKADEIECMESIAKSIPDGTYLKDLFTRDFISWVSEQIKNDFPPDIMGTLQNQYNVNSQNTLDYNNELNAMRHSTNELIVKTTESYNELHAKIDNLTAKNERLSEFDRLYHQTWDKLCDAINESNNRMDKINELSKVINDMKIIIFDLEHTK